MKRITYAVGAVCLVAATAIVAAATAAPPGTTTCSGGSIAPGTYSGLVVTGTCTFAAGTVVIDGDLRVEDGAVLNDHALSPAVVHVTGNVHVGRAAVLGLGQYGPPADPVNGTVVDGNVVANQPLTLYLGAITVHGNVVSSGGGGGVTGEFRNFPLKDDVVDGNLVVQGWHGGWLGIIRDQVGGNVVVQNNASVLSDEGPGVDTDSTEVQTNVVGGNLVCHGNTPAAQVNALDGGQPNAVGGRKVGECAGL